MAHLSAVLKGGADNEFGFARDVFEGDALARLREQVTEEALNTPVIFTDNLSDRTLAALLRLRDGSCVIVVNVRFRVDPEDLAHAILEEIAHSQQVLDGVDFESQQHLPYAGRPYEKQAKVLARKVLGYKPTTHHAMLRREQPLGSLYDTPPVSGGQPATQ